MNDTIKKNGLSSVRIPKLHGHTKITLRDVKTGEVKAIEKDNMVTSAIANLFANNYANTLNVASTDIMPLRKMFGGVLCFANQLTENAANIYPPDQSTNALIAHAGDATASAPANPKLGALNETESGEITNGYKWVWDWTTSQGNGTIGSVGLCAAVGGSCGMTPVNTDYNPSIVADVYSLQFAASVPQMLDGNNTDYTKFYPILYNSATGEFTSVYISPGSSSVADKAVIRTIRHDVSEFGLNLGVNDWDVSETVRELSLGHEAGTSHTVLGNNYAIATDGTNIYIIRKLTNTKLEYWKITPSAEDDVTSVTITTTINIGEFPFNPTNSTYSRRRPGKWGYIPVHNDCIYVPTANYLTFIRINLTTGVQTQLVNDYSAAPDTFEPAYWIGDICYGYNYIINGDNIYPMAPTPKPTCSNGSDYFHHSMKITNSNSLLDCIKGDSSARPGYQCTTLNGLYLATIQNLTNAVTKSSSQTMKIEYSLTEVRS